MLVAGSGLLISSALAAPAAQRGGTLRVASDTDVGPVDPAWGAGWELGFATCSELFSYPDKEGAAGARVIREVARRYTVSKDGRTYTFELKRTFRFQNGAQVTAHSFADAFNRDANPKLDSGAQQYLHGIVGADAVIAGTAKTISGIRVLGPYRLQITLKTPLGDFITRLTLPFFCPLLPNTPINPAGIDNPAGSGPYYVAQYVPNRLAVLKRNPFYRGGRPANVDQITFTVMSKEACLLATQQDENDLCLLVPNDAYKELADKYGINRKDGQFFFKPMLGTAYVVFNHDRPAFKGPGQIPLAKAINYAIDRPALVRSYGYLAGQRTDQMLPPAMGRDEQIYPLRGSDLVTARKWLAKASIKPSKLVLYWPNYRPAAAQSIAFDLKQIGIDVEVKYFGGDALLQKEGTRGEPFDMGYHGWRTDYADPAGYFIPLLSGKLQATGNQNYSYFNDPKVTARIEAANKLKVGGKARYDAWSDLDVDLMRNDPPWAPFLVFSDREFVSKSYGCFVDQPVFGVDLAAACKK
jgi:oligopeptide transport system substrate-binding protein